MAGLSRAVIAARSLRGGCNTVISPFKAAQFDLATFSAEYEFVNHGEEVQIALQRLRFNPTLLKWSAV
jgi:hypothetical protein